MAALKEAEAPPWLSADPCPCGSTRTYGTCCLRSDGRPLVVVPRLLPAPPATGYAHPKCYLRSTCDCSHPRSREHYVSKAVLCTIPGKLVVSGAPWLSADGRQETEPNSLRAHVLCKRHNEAMSPLDKMAARVFSIIVAIYQDLRDPSRMTGVSWYLGSGEMLELWGLKVLYGIHHAGVAAIKRIPTRNSHSLVDTTFLEVLSAKHLKPPLGLYFASSFW